MSENMTHMMLRLEAVRLKFNLSVDEINRLGEELLAKMSANMDQKKADEELEKVLVERDPRAPKVPATPPDVVTPEIKAKMAAIAASNSGADSSETTPLASSESPLARCANDDECSGSRVVDFPAPKDMSCAPIQAVD